LEKRLRILYALQRIDTSLDELHELKGDLPEIVSSLEDRLQAKEETRKRLEESIREALVRRDQVDLEIVSLKESIEKYKAQQFQVKTNKQYDALTRQIETSQQRVNEFEKEMELVEGKAEVARGDLKTIEAEIAELQRELAERRNELELVNKDHEEEELRFKHERDKVLVRIEKNDLRVYERIRKAKDGTAVVPVRRNACGGCFKRVPPQTIVELRKNAKLISCEHCGRILVSDEIVESSDKVA
jgi:predicted  nucleic acid-binding Zn-ribbon protein